MKKIVATILTVLSLALFISLPVASLAEAASDATASATMGNPWVDCTKGVAYMKLGTMFSIDAPKEYRLSNTSYFVAPEGSEPVDAARFVYVNEKEEMFRVHIFKEALEAREGWKQIEGTEAYYDAESNSVIYALGDYVVSIDVLGYTEEQMVALNGCVTIKE